MKLSSILGLLILLSLSKTYARSDSLRQVTFGVEANYHLSVLPERFKSNFDVRPTAKFLGILGFAEFHLIQRARFSTGIGFSKLSYSNLINNEFNANLPQPDSIRHLNIYSVSSKEWMISSTITCRFDYILEPNIYVILGLSPQFRLNSNESNTYNGTSIRSPSANEILFLANPDPARVFNDNIFTVTGELGIGAEIRNVALEFSFRKISIDHFFLNFYGFRIRYKI